MKVAVYYHIPFRRKNDEIYLPDFFGLFIDSLCPFVDELYFIAHEDPLDNSCDYKLNSKNLYIINLGEKTPAWHRDIFHNKILKRHMLKLNAIDYLIVRSPSPLAPYFYKFFPENKLFYFVVGDYGDEYSKSEAKSIREWLTWKYLLYNDFKFRKRLKNSNIIVNSMLLYEKYKNLSRSIKVIKTTTLSKKDFYSRQDTCHNKDINILYTGRFEVMKGLLELFKAFKNLTLKYDRLNLILVGWDVDPSKTFEKKLKHLRSKLNLNKRIKFHGKKKIGEELNEFYRKSDIYIMPSHFEGFPRTIWEAMANSLPVIATKVGGIPYNLNDGEDSLLIESKNHLQIEEAILEIINNNSLRKKIIKNGHDLAKSNTLDSQAEILISHIKK